MNGEYTQSPMSEGDNDDDVRFSSINDMQIFWNEPEGTIDVYGIYLFGLFKSTIPEQTYKSIASIWAPLHVESLVFSRKYNEGLVCDIPIRLIRDLEDPLDLKTWLTYIESSLTIFVQLGAIAAWAGFEDSSPVPEIFAPSLSGSNAFAVSTKKLGFICNSRPEDPMRQLSTTQMYWVWREIQQSTSKDK
jgi:hypothetical protein